MVGFGGFSSILAVFLLPVLLGYVAYVMIRDRHAPGEDRTTLGDVLMMWWWVPVIGAGLVWLWLAD